MTDEEIAEAINEVLKEKFDNSSKDIMIWWMETALDYFDGLTPVEVFDDGKTLELLEYVKTRHG